tara:strand:+ start:555 stop:932 length:378 start_codon:yes stop_codon:yes gene_type:complete
MKKFWFWFVIIICCSSCENDIDKSIRLTAEELNKSCPVFIDDITRADRVEIDENGFFHYVYTFPTLSKNEIDLQHFYNTQKDKFQLMYNSSEEFEIFRKHEISLKYTYYDMYNNQIISLIIGNEK